MSYEQRAEAEFFYACRAPRVSPRMFLRHPLQAIKWSHAIYTVNRVSCKFDPWLRDAPFTAAALHDLLDRIQTEIDS